MWSLVTEWSPVIVQRTRFQPPPLKYKPCSIPLEFLMSDVNVKSRTNPVSKQTGESSAAFRHFLHASNLERWCTKKSWEMRLRSSESSNIKIRQRKAVEGGEVDEKRGIKFRVLKAKASAPTKREGLPVTCGSLVHKNSAVLGLVMRRL